MKDLIDYLRIYRARTVPKHLPKTSTQSHYTPSARAAEEVPRWPTKSAIDGAKR